MKDMNTPTCHNSAKKGDFAQTVLMSGDPLRIKYIVDNYLEKVVLVNNVRGVQGYTGYYKGKKISLMAHGMGMPSMFIYAYELYNFYDVKNIIRMGTCGGLTTNSNVGDVVLGDFSMTASNIGKSLNFNKNIVYGDSSLLEQAEKISTKLKKKYVKTGIFTSDTFDLYVPFNFKRYIKKGCSVVEMESYMLYLLAHLYNKRALSLLTITDNSTTKESLSAEERRSGVDDMIKIALETAIKIKD